jgi:AraC-like DNA-binding protein
MLLPKFFKINYPAASTINIVEHKRHHFINSFHYHPELEISLIKKSKGIRFVGDNIEPFEAGDLVFIGSNMPHCWRNDAADVNNLHHQAEMLTIQFSWNFIGDDFYKIPECNAIVEVLRMAARGIRITGKTGQEISEILLSLENLSGISRIISLISILDILSNSTEIFPIASVEYVNTYSNAESSRINKIHQYLVNNFSTQLSLNEVAAVANISATAFCRYLKTKTGKTYSLFLNEIRIKYACKLLVSSALNQSEIAIECGYNTLSNFSIQFKQITGQTPKEYQAQYKVFNI